MNAHVAISPDIRASLLRARDIALNNVGTMHHGWTREINALMADIANQALFGNLSENDQADALDLCRHLMRDQAIAGKLERIF